MDDETLERRLRQFGLSEKELDTYMTILRYGEAKASTIAEAADVSKRYVYSVSEELEARGFVTVNDHVVPTTIRALPPGEVIESLKGDLDRMQTSLEGKYSAAEAQQNQFEVLKARVTVLERMAQRIDDANHEVVVSVPQDRLPELSDSLAGAVDRGVLVVLLVSNVDDEQAVDLDGLASVARTWSEPMPTMVTVDNESGLVAPSDIITRSETEQQAIAFRQQQLGPVIVGSFFGNYWPNGTEVYVAEPQGLPAAFREFRPAVFHATCHLESSEPLRAEVEGRLVGENDELVTLEGQVIDTRQGMVTPETNSFPVEAVIVLETDEGQYSIGGEGAFIEDFEATSVRLLSGE
jgi:sugar-specific transcriptional regulator TrmB